MQLRSNALLCECLDSMHAAKMQTIQPKTVFVSSFHVRFGCLPLRRLRAISFFLSPVLWPLIAQYTSRAHTRTPRHLSANPVLCYGCTNLGQNKNGIAGAQKESFSNRNSSACSILNRALCVKYGYIYIVCMASVCVCVKALFVFAEPKQCCGKANYLHKSHGLLILFLVSRVKRRKNAPHARVRQSGSNQQLSGRATAQKKTIADRAFIRLSMKLVQVAN